MIKYIFLVFFQYADENGPHNFCVRVFENVKDAEGFAKTYNDKLQKHPKTIELPAEYPEEEPFIENIEDKQYCLFSVHRRVLY